MGEAWEPKKFNTLSDIEGLWIEKYFQLVFQGLKDGKKYTVLGWSRVT
jgi:hypothetical protein